MQNDKLKFKNFVIINFPHPPKISAIYIYFFIRQNKEIPLYVGESGRFRERFGEYLVANHTTSTDFKVGESIYYLQEKGYKIIVKYKPTDANNRKIEQNDFIRDYQRENIKLLNDLKNIIITKSYQREEREKEREKIRQFIDNYILK